MKHSGYSFETTPRNIIYSSLLALASLFITILVAGYIGKARESVSNEEFMSVCEDIHTRIVDRLNAQAQLLRCSAALFSSSDSVTRNDWKAFYNESNVDQHLPGITGLGFSLVVSDGSLGKHTRLIRAEGYPGYAVRPGGKRELYTSIVYIEPFDERNQRAFGYDMYTEPVRRQAMQISCDSNKAAISGKVILVQETDVDIQAGVLMYVPVYGKNMPAETVEQRRAALVGWVYSPYRMNDLMNGILGNLDQVKKKGIGLWLYDGSELSEQTKLFSSGSDSSFRKNTEHEFYIPVAYHGHLWTLHLKEKRHMVPFYSNPSVQIATIGFIISTLIFILSLSVLNTKLRAQRIAEELTRELSKAKLEAEIANNAKSEFLLNIGHEFRTPLNAVIGYAGLIESGENKTDREYAVLIMSAARKLLSMVNDILDYIKSEKASPEFDYDYMTTRLFAEEIDKSYRGQVEEKGIRFSVSVSPDMPSELLIDGKRLRQIVSHLADNAVRFTGKGEISVKIYPLGVVAGDRASLDFAIQVADTGKGISEKFQKIMFDVFAREDEKATNGGIGIGLPFIHKLVSNMNGTIKVESSPGAGSIFTVSFYKVTYRNSVAGPAPVPAKKTGYDQEKAADMKEILNKEELLKELEGPFLITCRSFETRQPIGEVRLFGQELSEIGTRHNCRFVTEYGNSLVSAASTFDIDGMLRLLRKYGENIERLKN